jgi:hypothetical protein
MYEFDKLNGEIIKLITDDAYLLKNDKKVNISVIVTNKRLILLDYEDGSNDYEEALRTGMNGSYIRKKRPILLVNHNDISYIKETKYYDKYYLNNDNYFNLEAKEVKRFFIDKIKEA